MLCYKDIVFALFLWLISDKMSSTWAIIHGGCNIELGGTTGNRRAYETWRGYKWVLTRQWRSKEIDAKGREARRSGGWGLSNVNL